MKLHSKVFFFVLVVLVIACTSVFAEEEGSKRNAVLKRASPRVTPKTTTTTAAPSEAEGEAIGDEEYDNQEYGGEGEGESDATSSSTTTSTEAPKKIGPMIRPFRTNDDFLTSLKRRQQNAKKALKENKPTPKAPRTDEQKGGEEEESESAPAPAPATQSKFKSNSALSRRKPIKPLKPEPAAEEESVQGEESAPSPSPIGRRPGRLGLKPRN